MGQNHVFGAFWAISGQKSVIMGPNWIPNEKNVKHQFQIPWFPIIMQNIRKFPIARNGKNAIFGPKIRHYGPKLKPDEKDFNIVFNISLLRITTQKIRKFPCKPISRKWRKTLFWG